MVTIIIGVVLTGLLIWWTINEAYNAIPTICEAIAYGLTMLLVCGLGASVGVGLIIAAVVGYFVGVVLQNKIYPN